MKVLKAFNVPIAGCSVVSYNLLPPNGAFTKERERERERYKVVMVRAIQFFQSQNIPKVTFFRAHRTMPNTTQKVLTVRAHFKE